MWLTVEQERIQNLFISFDFTEWESKVKKQNEDGGIFIQVWFNETMGFGNFKSYEVGKQS